MGARRIERRQSSAHGARTSPSASGRQRIVRRGVRRDLGVSSRSGPANRPTVVGGSWNRGSRIRHSALVGGDPQSAVARNTPRESRRRLRGRALARVTSSMGRSHRWRVGARVRRTHPCGGRRVHGRARRDTGSRSIARLEIRFGSSANPVGGTRGNEQRPHLSSFGPSTDSMGMGALRHRTRVHHPARVPRDGGWTHFRPVTLERTGASGP